MFQSIDLTYILIVLGSILVSLTFHEAMHAYVGRSLGDTTAHEEGRVTLNPLRHIDPFMTILLPLVLLLLGQPPFLIAKPVPFNPMRVRYDEWGAALIAVAGPLTNLVLAVLAGIALRLTGFDSSDFLGYVLLVFVQINITVFVFNMIPFPPLDGSRVLYAVAPEPIQRIMQQIESFGLTGILLFMFLVFPILAPVVRSISGALLSAIL